MGGTECLSKDTMFLIDRYRCIKEGDIVKVEVDEYGHTYRVWINEKLFTKNWSGKNQLIIDSFVQQRKQKLLRN